MVTNRANPNYFLSCSCVTTGSRVAFNRGPQVAHLNHQPGQWLRYRYSLFGFRST